ncbi:hypothetical protein [Nocardia jiangxiensis]|uniref:hypothetical protein n=1 Tax=Nocardia jiangxiensis TaxID=282685 RepID=UPI000592A8F1|nr:hypothetical protein [Nocardia jiangxiensis]
MSARWGTESPQPEAPHKLPPQAVQRLQRIHALAAASTAITQDLADSAWPPTTVALWHKDLQRLNQQCRQVEQQAHESGVPRELITMAWFAGHCDTEWTPARADPTLGLRPMLGAELMGNAGQLHNMAAVLVSHELHPGSRPQRDPVKAKQLTRNMAAMFKQTAMLADLIGVSESGWESLWDLPQTAQREYLTSFLGPDAPLDLDGAWSHYTATDIESTVLDTIEQLEHRTHELRHHSPSEPRLERRGRGHAMAAATRTYRNAARQLREYLTTDTSTGGAVDAVLPEGTDRVWEPGDNTAGIADRGGDSVPEVEP